MKLLLIFDRIKNKISKIYNERIFFLKTGYKVNLVKNMMLVNKNIKLGKNVWIYPNVTIFGDGLIEIGDKVSIGQGTIIYASKSGGVKIGNNTMIAAQSYIIDADHGMKFGKMMRDQVNTVAAIEIGEDVWLGANVTVLKGSKIGNGAVIGAKSLVKGEIPEYSICVGVPAKVKKYRSDL